MFYVMTASICWSIRQMQYSDIPHSYTCIHTMTDDDIRTKRVRNRWWPMPESFANAEYTDRLFVIKHINKLLCYSSGQTNMAYNQWAVHFLPLKKIFPWHLQVKEETNGKFLQKANKTKHERQHKYQECKRRAPHLRDPMWPSPGGTAHHALAPSPPGIQTILQKRNTKTEPNHPNRTEPNRWISDLAGTGRRTNQNAQGPITMHTKYIESTRRQPVFPARNLHNAMPTYKP